MSRNLDLESWNRREHFDYFRVFEKPFFTVCVDVDVSSLVARCRTDRNLSFFAATLYFSLKAANEVESFRYRIRGDEVIVHDVIHAGSTILRNDETFGFGYFEFTPNFDDFAQRVRNVITTVKERPEALRRDSESDDLMHYSVLPWIALTSFSHAQTSRVADSVPKIVFGKYRRVGESIQMPLSVEVHHALMDGLHVSRFVDRFQEDLISLPLDSREAK